MGVLDKIKNALFEVEYVEVEEPPEKEKKVKEKKIKEKKENPKPIAKKIVLPGRKEEKIEELQEEELKDEDFEIRPKNESVKQVPHEEFKFMDDNDFKVEEEYPVEEPKILSVVPEKKNDDIVEDEITYEEYDRDIKQDDYYTPSLYSREGYRSTHVSHESRPYGVDNSYNVSMHEYGTYEKKDEKTIFKPSPIISPIYGILDKNYKKEDVKEKKEVRLSSSFSRRNVSVDEIRNKAYGDSPVEEKIESTIKEDTSFEVEDEDENLLVDLSDHTKPEVKELTMGDALEYFQDLGLEYNVDYVDVSKEKSKQKNNQDIKKEEELAEEAIDEVINEENKNQQEKEVVTPKIIDVKEESNQIDDNDDNLFDLIDSMYQEDN